MSLLISFVTLLQSLREEKCDKKGDNLSGRIRILSSSTRIHNLMWRQSTKTHETDHVHDLQKKYSILIITLPVVYFLFHDIEWRNKILVEYINSDVVYTSRVVQSFWQDLPHFTRAQVLMINFLIYEICFRFQSI